MGVGRNLLTGIQQGKTSQLAHLIATCHLNEVNLFPLLQMEVIKQGFLLQHGSFQVGEAWLGQGPLSGGVFICPERDGWYCDRLP